MLDRLIIERLDAMEAAEGPEPGEALRKLAICWGGFSSRAEGALLGRLDHMVSTLTPCGFTREAAAAILGLEDNPTLLERRLATLCAWQFITLQVITNGARHERYTLDRLVALVVGYHPDAHHPHYLYYAALAQRCSETGDTTALAYEHLNLEVAFDWVLRQDLAAAFQFYSACADFLARSGHLDSYVTWIEMIAHEVHKQPDLDLRGAVYLRLGLAYQNYPAQDRRAYLLLAVIAYHDALEHYDPETNPQGRAAVQHDLGTAYADLARLENRAENLWMAVAAYSVALHERTPETDPAGYAATQNALGAAFRDLAGIEHRAEYLEQAIQAYQDALNVAPPDSADTAALQNNLGNAYRDLAGVQDAAANLRRAIDAYHAALQVRTPQTAPPDYAATQNNLGTAYRALADEEDQALNLHRAIDAFEAALHYYTPPQTPLDYAAARSNLGGAYRALAKIEDTPGNLARAVAALDEALHYLTPQTAPLDYARAQANLGLARQDLGDRAGAVACWREAAEHFQRMGETAKAELMLELIAAANPDQTR